MSRGQVQSGLAKKFLAEPESVEDLPSIFSEVVTCPNGSFRRIAQSGGWIGGTVSSRAGVRPELRQRAAAAGGLEVLKSSTDRT